MRRNKDVIENDFPNKQIEKRIVEKNLNLESNKNQGLEIKHSKSDNNFDDIVSENKVKEIINHSKIPINAPNYYNVNNNNNNNFTNLPEHNIDFKAIPKTNINLENLKNQYNANTANNDTNIKKIFRRDNNNNNNKFERKNNNNNYGNNNNNKFIRKYDEFYIKEEDMNFENNKVNCSEYNLNNRKFQPEIIPDNSLYYYKFSKNQDNDLVKNNRNIIKANFK